MKKIALWLINFYRIAISPYKKPCCRYTPTCSAYALEAFGRYGFFTGFKLSLWRILRCNPFGSWGYDPVPDLNISKECGHKPQEHKPHEHKHIEP